jgi:hypothetical protein
MKKYTLGYIISFLLFITEANAIDTLFYENFDSWDYIEIEDSIFTDYDEDGLTAANGLPGGWFVANLANGGADTTDVVAISASWLEGYYPGNRNWLMLPAVHLGQGPASFSWRSAPALGNLYLDGYTVLVSTNPYFYYDINLADTLMHFAQNINDNENDFSEGIIHTEFDYNAPMNIAFYTQYPGLLTNWTADLSAYQGETIYLGFLHNSDDDNFIALDDILVMGTPGVPDTTNGGGPGPVGIEPVVSVSPLQVYPTLVEDVLTISYSDPLVKQQKISVFGVAGQLIMEHYCSGNNSKHLINVADLESGIYLVGLESENGWITNKFLKK